MVVIERFAHEFAGLGATDSRDVSSLVSEISRLRIASLVGDQALGVGQR